MPLTAPYTGSATIGATPVSLVTGTTTLQTVTDAPGIYQVCLDLSALTSTDVIELDILEAATAAGAQRLAYTQRLAGPVAEPIYLTPSLVLMHGWDVRLAKLAGTDRAVSWSLRRVA